MSSLELGRYMPILNKPAQEGGVHVTEISHFAPEDPNGAMTPAQDRVIMLDDMLRADPTLGNDFGAHVINGRAPGQEAKKPQVDVPIQHTGLAELIARDELASGGEHGVANAVMTRIHSNEAHHPMQGKIPDASLPQAARVFTGGSKG